MRLPKIIIECKEASMLSSKEQETSLSWLERITHRIHLSYCSLCRRFQQQIILIHKGLTDLKEQKTSLTEVKKNELKRLIENEM